MRIRVSCPSCGVTFSAGRNQIGRVAVCSNPACGLALRVPPPPPKVVFDSVPFRKLGPNERAAERRGDSRTLAGTSRRAPNRAGRRDRLVAALALVVAVGIGLFALRTDGDPALSASALLAAEPPADATAADSNSEDAGAVTLAAMVEPEQSYAEGLGGFLETHCVDCHGPDYAEADLDLGSIRSAADLRANREAWERTLAILKVGAMPPSDMPQPTPEERAAAIDWIDRVLHEVDCNVRQDPGRVTVRRLNRAEYDNTVRDLLGVDLSLSEFFPTDDVGDGFDNQGDVLTLPPLLLEKYLDAARKASEAAIVGDPSDLLTKRESYGDGRFVDTLRETFEFPEDGRYTIRIHARAEQAGSENARYAARLDGETLGEVTLLEDDARETFERTLSVKAGRRRVEVRFLNDFYRPEKRQDRNLYVEGIEVVGPLGGRPKDLPEAHRELVIATPEEAGSVAAAAEAVFRPLATRAFRRPATDLEVQRLASLVDALVSGGRTYEQALQLGVQAVLCSPHFLFRIEDDAVDASPGDAIGLSDYELASRLSYFLWASMPDEELFDLAERGKLSDPETLSAQIDRMLADPKAAALIEGFFAQWLNLGLLHDLAPDGREAGPLWNTKTKAALRRETELLCREIVQENLPVTTFLTADFTFVNPRLAEFYGLPWEGRRGEELEEFYVDGLPGDVRRNGRRLRRERRRRTFDFRNEEVFKRVPLPENRRGLLTHGSVLALTSNPVATSPVKRGKWILDNILGTPPPPAPPNVPALEESRESADELSLRDALARHREDPACASCHAVMDPLGLAFEHYDLVGRWREKDGRFDVDASGELPDGQTFNGAPELVALLEDRSDDFVRHFTGQLMTYGLGRSLEWYDRCAVDAAVKAAEPDGMRFQDLVKGIVLSDPFLKRRAANVAAP